MVDAPRHAKVIFLTQLQLETPSHASDLFIYFSAVEITICENLNENVGVLWFAVTRVNPW